jgi:receptor protein-tyrosine kinase
MAETPSHLVERMAERLRGVGGLKTVGPAPAPAAGDAAGQEAAPPAPALPVARAPSGEARTQDFGVLTRKPGPAETRHNGARAAPGTAAEQDAPEQTAPQQASPQQAASPGQAATGEEARAEAPPGPVVPVPGTEPAPVLDKATLERAGMVVGHKVRTRISEEFRITVGQLLRSMQSNYSPGRGAPNVVMITSARPGEGKTFSALNLAGSIAQHTQRDVLLVDVDAKRRSISSELGLGDRPGLLDVSTDPTLRIEDIVVRTAMPHLSVVPIGKTRADGIGGDGSSARPLTALIERIARRFPNGVVLLDAPPCLSTSDPSTLAPFVGQIVLIVEAEQTQRNEVIAALDLVKACPSITLMLNKIRLTTSYTFGAYHYFGTYS